MESKNQEEGFEWVQKKLDTIDESGTEKLLRKIKENPLVPFGAALTTCCLMFGLYSFRKGNQRMSQLMMRSRVLAQGFTVVAIAGGLLLAAKKNLKEEK